MKEQYRIGLIGCGLRGSYLLHCLKKANPDTEVAALADPDASCAGISNRVFADGGASVFTCGESLISESDLDGVIIASPNHAHLRSMVSATNRKMKLLLEKPVATTSGDLATMWKAYRENKAPLIVGFCLRYTPFYQKVHEIVSSGRLGKILNINAEELMSDELSSFFARGNWRSKKDLSGGLLLEKCCHDMDIINWLAGSTVDRISSHAGRTFLNNPPQADVGPTCRECVINESCRFSSSETTKTFEIEYPSELRELVPKIEDNCVFSPQNIYPDHQVVNLRYHNGVLATFSVTQAQPATRRTIHILGSEARLYGILDEKFLTIYSKNDGVSEKAEVIHVNPDDSGHNGGDSELIKDFHALLDETLRDDRPGLREGIEAAMVCIAADQSVQSGETVALETLRGGIFGQDSETPSAPKVAVNV